MSKRFGLAHNNDKKCPVTVSKYIYVLKSSSPEVPKKN